jgi:hypothetical protein
MEIQLIKFDEIAPLLGPEPPLLNLGSKKNEEDERYRFLVLDNQLVIGDISTHHVLALIAENDASGVVEAMVAYRSLRVQGQIDHWVEKMKPRISAAGVVNSNGTVTSWQSIGFKVTTPQAKRSELARFIRQCLVAH